MTDLNPDLIEKALREFVKPRVTTNMSLDGPRAKLAAALSAVAPLIAAKAWEEGREHGLALADWEYGASASMPDTTNPYRP